MRVQWGNTRGTVGVQWGYSGGTMCILKSHTHTAIAKYPYTNMYITNGYFRLRP